MTHDPAAGCGGSRDAHDSGDAATHSSSGRDGAALFARSATAWLVREAIAHANRDDADDPGRAAGPARLARARVGELLRTRGDLADCVGALLYAVADADVGLRWNLLAVLGDHADEAAASRLAAEALRVLPERARGEGCEGPRDGELLVRTMAVEALGAIARRAGGRGSKAADALLECARARPDDAVLAEVVKAARANGLADDVARLLDERQRWMLELRDVGHETLAADLKEVRIDDRTSRSPRLGADRTTPHAGCGCRCAGR